MVGIRNVKRVPRTSLCASASSPFTERANCWLKATRAMDLGVGPRLKQAFPHGSHQTGIIIPHFKDHGIPRRRGRRRHLHRPAGGYGLQGIGD